MVKGIDTFKDFFKGFEDNYIIIGGTACDILEEQAGFRPRATKDIDMILVVEALTPEFGLKFWEFIQAGKYENNQESKEERQYFRFSKPQNPAYPKQIEIFSRKPDVIQIPEGTRLTPIPMDEEISSLSAILMDDEYYKYTLENSTIADGLHIADRKSLICLKAKAYNDLSKRKQEGQNIDSNNIKKHKSDIFRIAVLLTDEDINDLPDGMKKDLSGFCNAIKEEIPDSKFFKDYGIIIEPKDVFEKLCSTFHIEGL